MKFLTLFKIILISNICIFYGYTERIEESPSDRYENVLNKSIIYIQYSFSVLSELEDFKSTTHELICDIDKKVRTLEFQQGGKKLKGIQKILNRLEYLSKHLQEQIEDWEYQLSQADTSAISFDINSKVRIGDYKNTIKNLIKLYGYIVKLITKFNVIKDQTERHIENISHDISNVNTSMANKEKTTKDIHNVIVKLTRELKTLTRSTLKEVNNCKKQIEDINNKIKEINKININVSEQNNKEENNNDNEDKENSKDKEELDNNKEKDDKKSKKVEKQKEKKSLEKSSAEETSKDIDSKKGNDSRKDNDSKKDSDSKNKDSKSKDNKDKSNKSESKDSKAEDKKSKSDTKKSKDDKSDNSDKTEKNDVKKKSDEITLDDITDEEIIEYFRNKKSKSNEIIDDEENNSKEKDKDTEEDIDEEDDIHTILKDIDQDNNRSVEEDDDDN